MSSTRKPNQPVPQEQALERPKWQEFFARARAASQPPAEITEDAKANAQELRRAVLPASKEKPQEQGWMCFAPMPTDLCRVSPFFPMSKNEMANRVYLQDMVITKSSWGEINYTGPKLSIYEEDALMAVLAAIDAIHDKSGYTYKGPILPLLKLIGYERPSKTNYKMFVDALKMLSGSVFELHVKGQFRNIDNILSNVRVDEKTKNLSVTVNPYFFEMYLAGSVTLISIVKRMKLKKPTSRALYRFMQSHRDAVWPGHFLTLAASLNLSFEQEKREIRRQIKEAIAECVKHEVLAKGSGFERGSNENVRLIRPGAKHAVK